MDTSSREHDLVLYGATGFVGRLLAAYIAEHAPAGMRVGLAGRSTSRLEAVRSQLPAAAHEWTLIEADSEDTASIAAMAATTRVLFTTVGPYAKHGLPVVEACARAGTHYADLAGEVSFVREAMDRYDDLAKVQLVARAKAGISGGTLESMRGQLDAMRSSTALRSLAADPYALSPDRTREPTTPQPPDAAPGLHPSF